MFSGTESCTAVIAADRKTKQLCKRLLPQQIALIDHADVDEMAAQSLLEAGVRAVINLSPFMTGRYPAEGARSLLQMGVPLYEWNTQAEHPRLIEQLDGAKVMIRNNTLFLHTATGWRLLDELVSVNDEAIAAKWQEAHARLDDTLSSFIDNTLQYAVREKDLFLKRLCKLRLKTRLADRHVVVVVRGKHYKEDLQTLAPYIREYRPVLIGVDGGADALLESGYRPDLIVGDMDSVTDKALCCGAEVVVHAFPDGRSPGEQRVRQLGLAYHVLPAPGTSEDVAMLLAFENQAELIVTIGTHTNMIDFLEKGRKGMASTLLVRTKIGTKLIDAKGVSQLYQPRWSWKLWGWCLAAMIVPVLAILAINPVARHAVQMLWMQWRTWAF
ncbi:putative cytokinetic ring protein SteA [Brevibacillus sp. TJ4]|uniref:putative cytokinetic ring protein SteA n=1 Tax=Brevibacillus sp. TJ4 TaxID=3234853 RepID=UPI0037D3958B